MCCVSCTIQANRMDRVVTITYREMTTINTIMNVSTPQNSNQQWITSSIQSEQIKKIHIDSSSTQTLDIVKISESSTVQDLQEQHVINSKQSEQIKYIQTKKSTVQNSEEQPIIDKVIVYQTQQPQPADI